MIELIGKNGSGKTFIANELSKRGYQKVVGYTTRKMRNNEIDKVDYNFITKIEFEYMLHNNIFIDYKVRSGNYYGISRNGITNTSIIISGNSDSIAQITGFKVYKIYLDANLKTRYARMNERNSEDNLFDRIHSENFSFLDNFQALFIDNDTYNMSVIDYIESVIKNGVIPQNLLKDNKQFIQRKVYEYKLTNYKNLNAILDILEYEEYVLRSLSLMNGIDKEKVYYKLIREYLDMVKVKYEENAQKILVLSNEKVYNLDYKER